MQINNFLSLLQVVKISGNGWTAKCPAHDDGTPSLSISTGDDGRTLLRCHAGCTPDAICSALGLKLSDLFSDNGHVKHNGSPSRIVATYPYHDVAGKVLFEVVRYDPKDFRQRKPDTTVPHGWTWNAKGIKKVLFRLPETLAAIQTGKLIFLCEGEKDVLAMVQRGFDATCNPGGAVDKPDSAKWQHSYTETLRCADVVIVADKDEAGRRHAALVAETLRGVAKSVRVLELPDVNTKPVKDAFDFFAAGGTADALRGLVKTTPELLPAVEPQPTKPGSAAGEYLGAEIQQLEWPEPKPLPADLPAVPPFNFVLLPDTFQDWIEDIAERMQCPPDFPAVGAMIAVGSLVGRKIGIRPKRYDDWLVIPNLWGCVVGRPGLMKTPALEQPLLPLRRLVADALDKYAMEMRDHEVNTMLKSQRAKLAEKKITAHLKKGDEQAARAEAETVLKKEGDEPICRRYETNDPTIEKLGVLLAENPTGLLLFRDELVGFLRGLDREGHESDRAIYLEMWNGTGSFTSDRIQRGTIRTPAILSILGGIQPDLLTAYVREAVRGGQGADGLLQRIQLFVWPDISREWRHVDRWPDVESKNKAFDVFKYLDSLKAETIGADMSSDIPFLRFTTEAQERFDVWRAALEKTLRSDTEHPAFEAHLSKYRKLVPALALLTHLANRGTAAVSLVALDKALLWATYLEAHARRIYSAVLRPDMAAARELAKHLKRGELPERFTLRETYRKGWAGLNTKEDAEAATEILCDLGWIRAVADGGRATGRPASPTFETSPKISNCGRSELTELTKPTSGSFGSEVPPTVEKFTTQTEAASEPGEYAEVPLIL